MEKRIKTKEELLSAIWNDDISMTFDSVDSFHSMTSFDSESDSNLKNFIDGGFQLSGSYLCGYVEDNGWKVFITIKTRYLSGFSNAQSYVTASGKNLEPDENLFCIVVRKFFKCLDYRVAFKHRKTELPYMVDYSLNHEWSSKRYNRCSKNEKNYPAIVRNSGGKYGQYTLTFDLTDHFTVGEVILSADSRYICNVSFYKNYSKVIDLAGIQSISPEIAYALRFKARSVHKFTRANKVFREYMKIIEMMAI